jgi:uncharacterized repeat protein (TIGR03803 family)
MRLRSQARHFRHVASFVAASCPLFVAAPALAELPQSIVAPAPGNPRGAWYPNPGLLLASDGIFYGSTRGQNDVNGTVFKFSVDATAYETVAPFSGSEVIYSGLAEGPDGVLYGTIYSGQGSIAKGAVFKVSKTGVLTTLHAFTGPDGANPAGPLVIAPDGTLYGTTLNGGADTGDGFGTVFAIDPAGAFTTLHDFGIDDGAAAGAHPRSNLLRTSDGSLYGTTTTGGPYDGGTVFRLTASGALDAVGFGDTNGFGPHDLVLACNTLYGRAFGASGRIFQLSLSLGPVSTLHGLAGAEGTFDFNEGDGQTLGGGLIVGRSGKLYGVAGFGNTNADLRTGTVFELALDGTFTVLYTFKATAADGRLPWGIAQGPDGNLYGTEQGSNNGGGIFKLAVPSELNTPVACPVGTGGTGMVGQGGSAGAGGSNALGAGGGAEGDAAAGATGAATDNAGVGGSATAADDDAQDRDEDAKVGGCSYGGADSANSGWAFVVIGLSALGLRAANRSPKPRSSRPGL